MFVVAGVTGNTGSRVASGLLKAGKPVRVIVRKEEAAKEWRAKGADAVVFELSDETALTAALKGAEGAYLLVPPYYGSDILKNQNIVAQSIAGAIKAAKPKRTVLLSSIAAHQSAGTGPIIATLQLERAVTGLSGVTALRAGYFLNNWLAVKGAYLQGAQLPSFLPKSQPLAMVSTDDIGDTAVSLLLQPETPPAVVELSGPVDHHAEEIAAILSQILGKSIETLHLPTDAVVPAFVEVGVPEELAQLYQEMYVGLKTGVVVWENPTNGESRRGSDSAEAFFKRHLL